VGAARERARRAGAAAGFRPALVSRQHLFPEQRSFSERIGNRGDGGEYATDVCFGLVCFCKTKQNKKVTSIPRLFPHTRNNAGKWVCDPFRLGTMRSCLMYSFGSADTFDFEEGVRGFRSDCEVHIFDPTSSPPPATSGTPPLHFHAFGLGPA
jgi:hypothetical protein